MKILSSFTQPHVFPNTSNFRGTWKETFWSIFTPLNPIQWHQDQSKKWTALLTKWDEHFSNSFSPQIESGDTLLHAEKLSISHASKPMCTGHHLELITIITLQKKSVASLFHRRPPSFTATSLFSSLFICFCSQCRLIKPCNIQKLRTTAWFIIRYDFLIDPSSVFIWDKCARWISMRANDKRSGVWRERGQTYFRRDVILESPHYQRLWNRENLRNSCRWKGLCTTARLYYDFQRDLFSGLIRDCSFWS